MFALFLENKLIKLQENKLSKSFASSYFQMMDMKVYIETDSDIRLARRLQRDIMERGRDLEGVLKQYEKFVKPSFDYYIAPTVVHADLIVPRGLYEFLLLFYCSVP